MEHERGHAGEGEALRLESIGRKWRGIGAGSAQQPLIEKPDRRVLEALVARGRNAEAHETLERLRTPRLPGRPAWPLARHSRVCLREFAQRIALCGRDTHARCASGSNQS
jgi:hypothetical protein